MGVTYFYIQCYLIHFVLADPQTKHMKGSSDYPHPPTQSALDACVPIFHSDPYHSIIFMPLPIWPPPGITMYDLLLSLDTLLKDSAWNEGLINAVK